MNFRDVLAVVVSYNGVHTIRQTVEALRDQVGYVHIVDNGSCSQLLEILGLLNQHSGTTVEYLGENRGVGYALNRGVQRARQMSCTWLLTMDQDSLVDSSFIKAYEDAIRQKVEWNCLAPRVISNGLRYHTVGGAISHTITSGNLVHMSLFDEIGLYDEGFFIDGIDFDFCLRLRRAGFHIHRVPSAKMHHQLGEPVAVPPIVRNYYAQHSPTRRYYMSRNFLYLVERYLFKFPEFIAKLGMSHALLLLLIAFYDPKPLASYGAIARGIWDYFVRKHGPFPEHAV